MDCYTLDIESYYDPATGYSLSAKGVSTEDYVCDRRFEVIGISVKRNDIRSSWFSGTMQATAEWLRQFPFHKNALTGHNMIFDGLVLQYHFGIVPKLYIDTLSMARPIVGSILKSLSLASLAKYFGLGEKGDEVVRAMGKRRLDFTPWELAEYGRYCVNDTDLTRALYLRMRHHARPELPRGSAAHGERWVDDKRLIRFPDTEMRVIDHTMRMYLQPKLELSEAVLQENQRITKIKKAEIVANMEVQGITAAVLRSNDKFSALLESMGIEVPLKPSPTDLKKNIDPPRLIPAFGKNDEAFKDLQEEYADNLEVSTILNARISEKSTQEETRTAKLLEIRRKYQKLRVPIKYSGAHTHRDSGTEGINLQNPPKTDKSRMRFAIVAPPGHKIVDADQAQIEARAVAACAGAESLVQQFARGEDVYSNMASQLYGRPVDRKKAAFRENGEKYFPDYTPGQCGKGVILGCGFGMGPPKFQLTLAGQYGVKVDLGTATQYVYTYRNAFPEIPEIWGECDAALRDALLVGKWTDVSCVSIGPEGIRFPNDTLIAYPNLAVKDGRFTYRRAKDKFNVNIYGAKVTENFIQKIARDIVFEQAIVVHKETGFRPVMRNHDALAYVVPDAQVDTFSKELLEIMAVPPSWLPTIPLMAEVKTGQSYGDT